MSGDSKDQVVISKELVWTPARTLLFFLYLFKKRGKEDSRSVLNSSEYLQETER